MENEYSKIIPGKEDNFRYMQSERGNINLRLLDLIEHSKKRKLFYLYNKFTIGLDRLIDWQIYEDNFFLECKDLVNKTWNGEEIPDDLNEYESYAVALGQRLRDLHEEGFDGAKHINQEVLEILLNGYMDASRRWKILPSEELLKIKIGSTKPYFSVLLYITVPEIEEEHAVELSTKYGLPAKESDDLADFYDDIAQGFINIPKEEIKAVKGLIIEENHIKGIEKDRLKLEEKYIKDKIKQIGVQYRFADKILGSAMQNYPENKEALQLIAELSYSWFIEAKVTYKL